MNLAAIQTMAPLLQINLAAIQTMAPLLQINLAAIQAMAHFKDEFSCHLNNGTLVTD
jgi:hypothetical protein